MAQSKRVTRAGGSYEYVVVDNGVPAISTTQVSATLGSWSGQNPDGSCKSPDDEIGGAAEHATNVFGNGTIPDCVARSSVKVSTPGATVRFLNPA